MKEAEKIKRAIKKCLSVVHCNNDCPYAEYGPDNCIDALEKDVTEYIERLEERIAIMEEGKTAQMEIEGGGVDWRFVCWWFVCGECHTTVYKCDNFCRKCGRRLISEGVE